jgi:hypothetical protein
VAGGERMAVEVGGQPVERAAGHRRSHAR